MTRKKFENLKNFETATFALWNFDDIRNIDIIEKNLSKLHTNIIILGLNPSASITFPNNFHCKEQFDGWYRDAFSKVPFQGAYMTDLISYPQASSRIVIEKWEKSKLFRDKNIKALQQQFKVLGVQNPTIICLGENTHGLFCETNIKTGKVWYIKHPNSYRMSNPKETFINDVVELSGKI